jgi:hypothetical protein
MLCVPADFLTWHFRKQIRNSIAWSNFRGSFNVGWIGHVAYMQRAKNTCRCDRYQVCNKYKERKYGYSRLNMYMLPTCSKQEVLVNVTDIDYVISTKNENMDICDWICKFRWLELAGDGSPMTGCTVTVRWYIHFALLHTHKCRNANTALYLIVISVRGARGGAVGWGTALQAGRSRVRFPIISLDFFIGIILPTALWPWCWLRL